MQELELNLNPKGQLRGREILPGEQSGMSEGMEVGKSWGRESQGERHSSVGTWVGTLFHCNMVRAHLLCDLSNGFLCSYLWKPAVPTSLRGGM
jgi:hypothetical protein